MKKRIIALVLVVVMSVLTLASCGSFNFVNEDLSAYATFKYDEFKAALEKIVLEDSDDFNFTTNEEIRQAKVAKAVYEKVADAIIAAAKDDDHKTTGTLGAGDVLYYVYYAEDESGNVYFSTEMKETALTSSNKAEHVIKLGAIDVNDEDDDEIKKLIKENLVENADLSDYVYSMILADELQSEAEKKLKEDNPKATAEEITAAKEAAIKVQEGDKIVISYKRSYVKTEEAAKPTITESAAYETVILDNTDPFLAKFLADGSKANVGGTLSVKVDGKDKTEFNVVIGEKEYTYSDVKILWKVEKNEKGNFSEPIATFKYTHKEDKNETPDNCRETTAGKVNLKGKELTYYVYPVYAIEAPAADEITAADLLKLVITAAKITKDSFDAFEDEGYVYKEEGKDDVKITTLVQEILDIYDTTKENNEFYKEGADLQKLNQDYLDKKAISDKTGATTDQKNATTDAKTALSDKQKEMADERIEKISACVKGTDKASDAIVKEYCEDTYHTMKEAYDTAITQAVQAKVWALIQSSVIVDKSKLPEKLVKEYKQHLLDSYEYQYYKGYVTGSSTVTNYSKYDTFDAYLMSKEVLDCTADKIDGALDAKAREYIVPIVQIYVVSKACEADALAALPTFIEQDIEEGKAYEVDEHSFEEAYGDKAAEKIAEAKKQADENKAQAREDAKVFIINDAFIKEYKKEIGRAYYRQLTEEYGEINLRASFQFNKLFYYLTSTNIVEGEHDGHKHTEVKYEDINGVDFIDFRIVKYTIEAKTADN